MALVSKRKSKKSRDVVLTLRLSKWYEINAPEDAWIYVSDLQGHMGSEAKARHDAEWQRVLKDPLLDGTPLKTATFQVEGGWPGRDEEGLHFYGRDVLFVRIPKDRIEAFWDRVPTERIGMFRVMRYLIRGEYEFGNDPTDEDLRGVTVSQLTRVEPLVNPVPFSKARIRKLLEHLYSEGCWDDVTYVEVEEKIGVGLYSLWRKPDIGGMTDYIFGELQAR